ncbi:hypothetical protein F7725_012401 [Dissostichus mawsoni]|uniref:Uncharacterized protein n=1 Tax=Dissostichus mawsoni TaxID=36200 RepID=A0A7J5YPE5_DISMA|nr:hypothetical protein F7725_012401 [Dissostichus mawsoni]
MDSEDEFYLPQLIVVATGRFRSSDSQLLSFSVFPMCLNGEEETSDSLESIEVSSSEETSPAVSPSQDPPPQDPITETPLPNVIQETEPPSSLPSSPPPLLISFPPLLSEDPQTSTDPLPLLPEDPANIALFVDVSPSADLLNVLPHVDASTTRSHPLQSFLTLSPRSPHPKGASKHRSDRGPCLRHVPVLHPEPEPEPRGDSKFRSISTTSSPSLVLERPGERLPSGADT